MLQFGSSFNGQTDKLTSDSGRLCSTEDVVGNSMLRTQVLWLQNKPVSSHFHLRAWQLFWGVCDDKLW